MSKFLKLLALLFAVALIAAACGNDDDDAAGPAGCGYATDGDVRGVDKDAGVITIGTSQPFTGRAAPAGEGLLGGLQMAVDEVNAKGGIDGCTFELAWEGRPLLRSNRWLSTSAR